MAGKKHMKQETSKSDSRFSDDLRAFLMAKEPKLLLLWYKIMAPPEPPGNALLSVRENVRHAQLGSLVILIAIFLAGVALPSVATSPNHFLLVILASVLVCQFIGLLLNRDGKVVTAGIIVVAASEIGLMSAFWFQPDGFSIFNLPLIDLLIQPTLFAVSLLPARSVFAVATINVFFVLLAFALLHHTPDLDHLLVTQGYDALVRPIILQIVVATIAFLWVRSSRMAIQRADRAENIAQLEHDLSEQAFAAARQKELLEASIQKILAVHVEVANGRFEARVPLTHDNVLWEVAGSLNNLLSRLQSLQQADLGMQAMLPQLYRSRQIEEQYKHLLYDIEQLNKQLQAGLERPLQIGLPHRQTPLTLLLKTLNGKTVISKPFPPMKGIDLPVSRNRNEETEKK